MTARSLTTTLVVPCYNEAARLDVTAFVAAMNSDPSLSVLFVDDGSTDATGTMLESAARDHDRIRALHLGTNVGKAEAVRQGVQRALDDVPDCVGYWDADLATPLTELLRFREALAQAAEVDAVLGSRVRLLGHAIDRRPGRHYAGRIAATLVSALLGVAVYDTQCGAKVFRVSPRVRSAFDAPFVSRWLFDVEILARLKLSLPPGRSFESSILELPVTSWRDVDGSKLTARDFVLGPRELWKIYRRYPL